MLISSNRKTRCQISRGPKLHVCQSAYCWSDDEAQTSIRNDEQKKTSPTTIHARAITLTEPACVVCWVRACVCMHIQFHAVHAHRPASSLKK